MESFVFIGFPFRSVLVSIRQQNPEPNVIVQFTSMAATFVISIAILLGLLLFLFNSYLEGGGWMAENWRLANAIFTICFPSLVILSLMSAAFSAWIKWRTAASAALFAVIIIPLPIGGVIKELFNTNKGFMLSLGMAFYNQSVHLLQIDWMESFLSSGESWFVFAAYAAICLLMLSRRVRAYEVVS